MAIVHATGLSLAYGLKPLMNEVNFSLEEGERVCLVGRNGEGKSTLMRILVGTATPDAGDLHFAPHTRVAYLPQEVPEGLAGSLLEVVLGGSDGSAALLDEYESISNELTEDSSPEVLEQMQEIQEELDRRDGWGVREAATVAIERIGLLPSEAFNDLSGGRKRQCLLVRALLSKPGLLLLDEPTNHLDIRAIGWLEDMVRSFPGAVLFVTHDRAFLRAVSTRILDLDRGKLTSWPGDYDLYRQRKAASLDVESKSWMEFDKHLAQEEVWIRQGIKARRTRNEGRVRALKKLRVERAERRGRIGSVKITLQESDRSGKRVVEAENISFAWPDKPIVDGFNLEIQRGDRLGIIGPNGCGKTTLLRLLLGEITPQAGRVRVGTKLEPLYFDQMRGQLEEDKTVQQNVTDRGDTVILNGRPRHVMGYLNDFLFSPERARTPVNILSGGERNRLLLAKLFVHEANLLILDEPTNDLDTDTLELLETTLLGYDGTLIVVSHDREFLNNVVTSCIAFDADGVVRQYAGGYDDWLQQRPALARPAAPGAPVSPVAPQKTSDSAPVEPARPRVPLRKLSYKEKRRLEQIPAQIEALEQEQVGLNEAMAAPGFFTGPREDVDRVTARLSVIEPEILQLMGNWEDLEARREGATA
jgi:ATP-binding cassette subfamily F protein uup